MSTISSVFKGYNANRKKSVRKGVPNGRLGRIVTAGAQLKRFYPEAYNDYNNGIVDMQYLAKLFGFRDVQLHYTRGWKTV